MTKIVHIFLLLIIFFLNKSYSQTTPILSNSLVAWYCADSISEESGFIDTLYDLSGNNYNLTQTIISKQPSYNTNILLNNHNEILFSNDFLSVPNVDLSITNKVSIILVLKVNSFGNGSRVFQHSTNGLFINDKRGISNILYNGKYLALHTDGVPPRTQFETNDANFNNYLIITSTHDRSLNNEEIKLYINSNNPNGDYTFNDDFSGNFSSETLFVGNDEVGNRSFDGNISELIIYSDILSTEKRDSIEEFLHNKYAPPINLGSDIHIPYGYCDTVTIDAGARFTNYLWSTGDTTQTITVNRTGQYSVTVTDIFGFQSSDSLMVYYPSPTIQSDSVICYGDTIKWNAGLQDTNYTFLWQDNITTDSIMPISQAGEYYVQITDSFGCIYNSDTAQITIDHYPETTTLGNDTSLCAGQNLFLQTGANQTVNYLWSDGSSNDYITINTAGDYSVTATNTIGCIATDTINIQIHGNAPIPGFDFANTCFNDNTVFIDTSFTIDNSNIISWQWDFGNGDTSNLQNPEIQYLDTGIYNITFIIRTDSNCSNTINKEIEIFPLPISRYTNTQLCNNNLISFINQSTIPKGNISSYLWDFGDGNFSTDTNPNHVYNNYAYYNLQLISISDQNCVDTLAQNIELKPSPISDFLTSSTCKNKVISFYNNTTTLPYNPVYETLWDFGDGTSSSSTNPNYLYNGTDTIYNVSLINKTINGCQDTITKQIRLYNNPKANFANEKICEKTITQLINTSVVSFDTISTYVWQIENSFYYEESPIVYFSNFGNSTIILTVTTNNNCSDKIEVPIPVLELPNPDFDINPKWGMTNEYTVLTPQNIGSNYWDFGNGETSTDSIPYTVYPDSGIFIIEHIITDTNNCVDTIFKDYRVVIPQNDIVITDLRYTIKNNILSVETDIINIGNLPVNKIKFTLSPDKYSSISETWEGELIYGYGMTYYFNATFSISDNKTPEYVCVLAEISDKYTDTNPNNNNYCTNNSNNIVLYPIYPNPAKDIINISFKLEANSHVRIKLFDNLGKIVSEISNQDYNKGFHKLTYNISSLNSGHYTISIDINNKNNVVKFIKEDK